MVCATKGRVNRLWLYRKAMGLSQTEVAKKLKLKCSNLVSRWEKGQCMPRGEQLLKLSILYKTLPNELYYELVQELRKELFPDDPQ